MNPGMRPSETWKIANNFKNKINKSNLVRDTNITDRNIINQAFDKIADVNFVEDTDLD